MLRRTRRMLLTATMAGALIAATVPGAVADPTAPPTSGTASDGAGAEADAAASAGSDYVVLYEKGASDAEARAAIEAAGGTVISSDAEVGYAVVTSTADGFEAAAGDAQTLVGATRDRSIGAAPKDAPASDAVDAIDEVERLSDADRAEASAPTRRGVVPGVRPDASKKKAAKGEPLSDLQWDMRAINATPKGSYATERGKKGVRVGIIDTGVDGSHPDIAPNFDAKASRNFTKDIPAIDGECEVKSCVDPADVDDDGHGTHVASTIGSPANGIGIAGVAPDVTLVNLRAGQDSGYFFLQPTLDAISEAGRSGIDVINMSFYVDPWLYNCTANPADSAAEQREQRVAVASVQRALDFARAGGVLPVSAAGNGATDLGAPGVDSSSPDYPVDENGDPVAARDRTIDNSTCLSLPAEQDGVVTVTSTGPSDRKAYYSDYGVEQSDLAAPGGDAFDTPDNRLSPGGLILAAYPEQLAREAGQIDEAGNPTTPFVIKDCKGPVCGYYQYLQGTSMAAPHAAGVAALIVSRYGTKDSKRAGEIGLSADKTELILLGTARNTACPEPREFLYRAVRTSGVTETTATCDGPADRNGFFGQGIVDAQAAVTALG